jgi:hypothetical protein
MIIDAYTFDSLDALLAEVSQPPKAEGAASLRETAEEAAWFGSANYAEAERMARFGWPEGLARMETARAAVQIPEGLESLTPSPVMAEEGDEILVDRYLDGESDHFLAFPVVLTPRAGRVALIVVNVGGSSDIDPITYFRRGAAALAVLDALERAGVRCEVQICQRSEIKSSRACQWFATIKRPEDTLDLDRMAFFLASASIQRRFSFRLRERSKAPKKWIDGSYGASRNIPEADIPEGAIYFPTPASNLSDEAALRIAQDKVKAWTEGN